MKKSRVGFTDNMSNKIDGFSSCSEFQGVKGFKSILPCSAPGRDQFCGAGRGGAGLAFFGAGRGGAACFSTGRGGASIPDGMDGMDGLDG